MKKLALCNADVTSDLAWPESGEETTVGSPALDVFTDFTTTKPLIIEANTSAVDAEKLMQKAHVRLKIVVDEDKRFLGIISLQDISAQEMMVKVSEGHKREDLSVADFMHSKHQLKGLTYTELSTASIRKVINALKDSSEQHCVVVDEDRRRLRGIISASDIARKLRLPLDIHNESNFSQIYKAIMH